jgi:hypothetical protein
MRKKIKTLLSILLLTGLSLSAQPVLDHSIVPQIGDGYKLAVAKTDNISEGNAGANQTWNFSTLQMESGTVPTQFRVVSPVGTPYYFNNPSANLVIKAEEDTVIYSYFKDEANKLSLLGTASLAFSQKFTDPDAQLQFPTNFNGSYQDHFEYETDAGTGFNFYSKGDRTIKYDGYGTIITPLGTFPNSIRLKSVSNQVDSADFFGTTAIYYNEITTYLWIRSGFTGNIATVYYTKTTLETRIPGFDTLIQELPLSKDVSFVSQATVGGIDLQSAPVGFSNLILGPNPASDQLNLNFTSERAGKSLKVMITDVMGRVCFVEDRLSMDGHNTWEIPVQQFSTGQYFLTISDGVRYESLSWQKH